MGAYMELSMVKKIKQFFQYMHRQIRRIMQLRRTSFTVYWRGK
jgi:hypothetical protein